jgi:hypothetical protein
MNHSKTDREIGACETIANVTFRSSKKGGEIEKKKKGKREREYNKTGQKTREETDKGEEVLM